MKKKVFPFRLESEKIELLKKRAKREGTKPSQLVRFLVERYLLEG